MLLAEKLSFLERIELGFTTALLGIALVFCVLALLIFVVYLMAYLVKNAPKLKQIIANKFVKNHSEKKKSKKISIELIKDTPALADATSIEDEEETVACIMGAISYIIATEQNIPLNNARAKFIVKSIKRT